MFLTASFLVLCFCAHFFILCLGQGMYLPPNKEDPFPCDTPQFANLEQCCPTPQFFPRDSVIWCIEEMGTVNPNENLTDFQEFVMLEGPPEFYSGAAGPMIVIECMFRNHSLLARSGLINMEKTMDHLIGVSDAAWRPVVRTIVETCILDLSILNVTAIPDSSFGNIAPAYFMSCLRRGLTINCPKSIRDFSEGCNETRRATIACSPFSVIAGNEGGPRGWIGALLKWLVGPYRPVESTDQPSELPWFIPHF